MALLCCFSVHTVPTWHRFIRVQVRGQETSSQTPRAAGTISSPSDGGETESHCSSQACPLKVPLAQCKLPGSACGVSSGTLWRPEGTSRAVATEDEPAVTVPGPSGESQSWQRAWLCGRPVCSSLPGWVALPGQVPGPWLSPHSLYQQLLDTKPLTRQRQGCCHGPHLHTAGQPL